MCVDNQASDGPIDAADLTNFLLQNPSIIPSIIILVNSVNQACYSSSEASEAAEALSVVRLWM